MMQFAEQLPDFGIVSPLATQLSWSHVVEVLALRTPEARVFYLGEAVTRQLGKRELGLPDASVDRFEHTVTGGKSPWRHQIPEWPQVRAESWQAVVSAPTPTHGHPPAVDRRRTSLG